MTSSCEVSMWMSRWDKRRRGTRLYPPLRLKQRSYYLPWFGVAGAGLRLLTISFPASFVRGDVFFHLVGEFAQDLITFRAFRHLISQQLY